MIILLLLGPLIAWVAYTYFCLSQNVGRARAMNVPIVVVPVSPMNFLWIAIQPVVFSLLDRLPMDLGTFGRYGRRDYHFLDKASTHCELGEVFALVTPCEIFLQICDPKGIMAILQRGQDFIRPIQLYKMLEVFGANVSTVYREDWARHRKIVAAPFNENTNNRVWTTSLHQATDMLKSWTSCNISGRISIAKDTRTLSLNVLAGTGFQRDYKFTASFETATDEERSYREALAIVLDNALFMMLVPLNVLLMPLVPASWARIGQATEEFRRYMTNLLKEERRLLNFDLPSSGNLMSSLVRASEEEENRRRNDSVDRRKGLQMSEILGNIFVINFAGHDTTANTLAYSILLLAANPQIQYWLREELQGVLCGNTEEWNYREHYSKLKRCSAILLETLRLYPPILAIPKYTGSRSQTLKVGTAEILIGPDVIVVPSLLAIHTHPKYWDDPLVWRPERWIQASNTDNLSSEALATRLGREELMTPRDGTYLPWSDGPQNCPGKRFAQVEVVSVLSCLFYKHSVAVVCNEGESDKTAQIRCQNVCNDSEVGLLLRMRDADQVWLEWHEV